MLLSSKGQHGDFWAKTNPILLLPSSLVLKCVYMSLSITASRAATRVSVSVCKTIKGCFIRSNSTTSLKETLQQVRLMPFLMRNVVFVASLVFMAALVPLYASPSIHCTVPEIKPAGSTTLFLTLTFSFLLSLC